MSTTEVNKCEVCGKDIGNSLWGWCSMECLEVLAPTVHQRVDTALEDARASAILEQIGYYRTDTKFCSLNLTDEQWKTISAATLEAGDISTEDMICRALKTNKQLYDALQGVLGLVHDYMETGETPSQSHKEQVLQAAHDAINAADDEPEIDYVCLACGKQYTGTADNPPKDTELCSHEWEPKKDR